MIKTLRLDVRLGMLARVALALLGLAEVTRANTVVISPSSVGTLVDNTLMGNMYSFTPSLGPVFVNQFGNASADLVFDLSFIPRTAVISSATFTMSANGSLFNDEPINLSVYSNIVSSSVVSMSNFNQNGDYGTFVGDLQGLANDAPPGSINAVTTFDVTGLIQQRVANNPPYASFQFLIIDSTGAVDLPGSTPPSLTITSSSTLTVPEPSGAVLMAIGIVSVLVVAQHGRRGNV